MRFESLILALAVSGFVSIAAADPSATTQESAAAPVAAPAPVAPAAPAAAPAAAAATVQSADADKVVCHVGPAPTGSRLGSTRECHTQREWDRIRQEQSNIVANSQHSMGCGPSGCGQ